MKTNAPIPDRLPPWVPIATVALLLLLVALSAARCAALASMGSPTPQPPVPASQTPTPKTPPFVLQAPNASQLEAILKATEQVERRQSHVPPPSPRVEQLEALYGRLRERGEIVNLADHMVFNRDAATTQAIPGEGGLLQVVSPTEAEDVLLSPDYPWGDQALVVGGLLVYQGQSVEIGGPSGALGGEQAWLPAGNYLVLLYRTPDLSSLKFQLRAEAGTAALEGTWQLRSLWPKDEASQTQYASKQPPRSFIAPNQLCFSQQVYQACLNVRTAAFGHPANEAMISATVKSLGGANLLPSDAIVFTETAVAAVVSSEAISKCAAALEKDSPADCYPDLVIAATEPYPADRLELEVIKKTAAVHGLARTTAAVPWQPAVTITETAAPIAVMRVLQPLPGDVFDWNGNPMDLAPADYRVDLLWVHHQGRWLTQFMWLDEGLNRYAYAAAEEVTTLGEPVAGQEQPTPCDVVEGSFIVRPCRTGGGSPCTALWCRSGCGKRDYCINSGRWC
ncbi:MAG: hypothetical protein RMN53_09155 [Anaerolineae bacterium]|nr:hypothetical protein [Anaerolineae bacterium]